MSDDHDHVTDPATTHRTPAPTDDHADAPAPALPSTLGNRGVARVLEGTTAQRAGATARQELDEAVARSIEERRGGGSPLGDDVRADMEGALGADLGGVRVHTDSAADELGEAVSATAFTSGEDVFFRSGNYDPGSRSGRELLAHELTHVVQQRTGTSGLASGEVSDPGDPAEVEAAAVGAEVASGGTAPTTAATGPGVSREEDEEEAMQLSVAREAEEDEEGMQLSVAREAEEDEEGMQLSVAREAEMEEEELLE